MKQLSAFFLIFCCLGFATLKNSELPRQEIVKNAQNFLGSKYKYASSNPKQGFDCSGLVYNVFGTLDIVPPRSSKDYIHLNQLDIHEAQIGDVIVFNGSKKGTNTPGHVGIISKVSSNNLYFIHASTSRGVIESDLHQTYYLDRYLFVVNLLED